MRNTLTIVGLMALSGCAYSVNGFRRGGLSRAAFDLGCPADQMTITELATGTMGVAGCGNKAVYVYDGYRSTWINNTGLEQSETAAPVAHPTIGAR